VNHEIGPVSKLRAKVDCPYEGASFDDSNAYRSTLVGRSPNPVSGPAFGRSARQSDLSLDSDDEPV